MATSQAQAERIAAWHQLWRLLLRPHPTVFPPPGKAETAGDEPAVTREGR